MKIAILIIISILCRQNNIFCQLPNFENNFTKNDSISSPLLDSFSKEFNFVFAYMEQASPNHNYKILAKKNTKWSYWTFSDNYLQWTKKDNIYKVDTIRVGTFWEGKKSITTKQADEILEFLNQNNFWKLRNDSLNQSRVTEKYYDDENGGTIFTQDKGPTDQINYRFEVYKIKNCRVIESYGPDYFVEKYPNLYDRKKFINCRDKFLKWWEMYCR